MKIVCESCGAKYSIADEKVAGRVFKIRCKRCSEVIVVRGDQPAAEPHASAPPLPAMADPAATLWHIVVHGEQQGPYEAAQLQQLMSQGAIDWEIFVWREGFDNWVPLREVHELVAQLGTAAQVASPVAVQKVSAAGGYAATAADAFAGEPSMGADPFADDDSGAVATHFYAPSTLNTPVEAETVVPRTGGGASGDPRASTAETMTGARNENSVLFSLKNLQALATGSNASDAGPGTGADATGFASGEGSGLIDIRALAAANTAGREETGQRAIEKDELLSLSGQGSAFGSLSSPMVAPPSEEATGGGRSILVASILGAALLLAGAMVTIAMLNRPEFQPAAAAPTPAAPVPAAEKAPAQAPEPPVEVTEEGPAVDEPEPPSEGELAARAAAAEAKQESEGRQASERPAARRRERARERVVARRLAARQRAARTAAEHADNPAAAAPTREQPPAKTAQKDRSSSLDDLLSGALDGKARRPAKRSEPSPAAEADSNLPAKPSRDAVIAAMNGVKGSVVACGKGSSNVAFANVTVDGKTGRVTNATIEGATGPVGSCIARAVRKARFPRFKAPSFRVKFPFRL